MTNRITAGREFLEAQVPGLYAETVRQVVAANGVVHLAPDCMLMGIPCPDSPRTLFIVFACAQLHALFGVLCGLRDYDRVRFVRLFKGSEMVRERDIREYARHLGLYDAISQY